MMFLPFSLSGWEYIHQKNSHLPFTHFNWKKNPELPSLDQTFAFETGDSPSDVSGNAYRMENAIFVSKVTKYSNDTEGTGNRISMESRL